MGCHLLMSIDTTRTKLILSRLSRLLGLVSRAASPEPVHQLRATIRRNEALFHSLVAEPKRDSKLEKKLKKLRRRAGSVRDLDVQVKVLRSVNIGGKGKQKIRISSALNRKRQREAKRLMEMLDAESLVRLRLQLREMALLLTSDSSAARRGILIGEESPSQHALRLFDELIKQMPSLDESNLHRFRTRCKQLRYIAEIEGKDRTAVEITQILEPIQDAVGEWHDWTMLLESAEEVLSSHTNSPLLSAIRNLTTSRLTTALRVCKEAKGRMLARVRSAGEAPIELRGVQKKLPQTQVHPPKTLQRSGS